MLPEATGPLLV